MKEHARVRPHDGEKTIWVVDVYDGRAGKQREKNGERLTDEQNQTRPMDMSVLQGEWVVDTFYPYWTFADGTA